MCIEPVICLRSITFFCYHLCLEPRQVIPVVVSNRRRPDDGQADDSGQPRISMKKANHPRKHARASKRSEKVARSARGVRGPTARHSASSYVADAPLSVVRSRLFAAYGSSSFTAASLLALVLLSLGWRVIPVLPHVFPNPHTVRLLGNDAYFHLRHATYCYENFPDIQRWDVGTHYPEGLWNNAAGLFDVALAGAALLSGGANSDGDWVARVAAWSPVFFAVLTIPALFWLSRMVLGRNLSLLVCATYVVYPGSSLSRTLLGFADHHCFEILLGVLSAGGLIHCLTRVTANAGAWWRPAVVCALPLAVFLFTWVGAPLVLLIQTCAVLALIICSAAAALPTRPLALRSLSYGLGLLTTTTVVSLSCPQLIMEYNKLLLAFIGIAGLALSPLLVSALAELLRNRRVKPGTAAACCAASVAMLIVAIRFTPWGSALTRSLLPSGASIVAEYRAVSFGHYWAMLGPVGLIAVVCVPLAIWRFLHHEGEPSRIKQGQLVLAAIGVMWLGLWFVTLDFGYVVPVFAAASCGLVVSRLPIGELQCGYRRAAGVAALIAAVSMPLWPGKLVNHPWASLELCEPLLLAHEGWISAMDWLNKETPEPSISPRGCVAPWDGSFHYPPDSYGVMSSWCYGNLVSALGQRTPVWSRYPSRQTARWLLCQSEAESLRRLRADCEGGETIRYVVLDDQTLGAHFKNKPVTARREPVRLQKPTKEFLPVPGRVRRWTYGADYENSIAARMYLSDGCGLSHYRLVYESPEQCFHGYKLSTNEKLERLSEPIVDQRHRNRLQQMTRPAVVKLPDGYAYDGFIVSRVKIFECVAGASIRGRGKPNSVIRAELQLTVESTDRTFTWHSETVASQDGRFTLRVPYSTEARVRGTAVCARGNYAVRELHGLESTEPPRCWDVVVQEDDVQSGAAIRLGNAIASAPADLR